MSHFTRSSSRPGSREGEQFRQGCNIHALFFQLLFLSGPIKVVVVATRYRCPKSARKRRKRDRQRRKREMQRTQEMENKGEEAQAHSHMCVTVLYPRNTKKSGRRKAERTVPLTHSHTSSLSWSSSSLTLLSSFIESHALSTAALCGYTEMTISSIRRTM